jgi:hypothetical protein
MLERGMDVVIRKVLETDFDQVSIIFADENAFHSQLLPERFQIADPIMTLDWLIGSLPIF